VPRSTRTAGDVANADVVYPRRATLSPDPASLIAQTTYPIAIRLAFQPAAAVLAAIAHSSPDRQPAPAPVRFQRGPGARGGVRAGRSRSQNPASTILPMALPDLR
jgi:hypothetical protein